MGFGFRASILTFVLVGLYSFVVWLEVGFSGLLLIPKLRPTFGVPSLFANSLVFLYELSSFNPGTAEQLDA